MAGFGQPLRIMGEVTIRQRQPAAQSTNLILTRDNPRQARQFLMARQRRKKQTRLVQSHLVVSLERSVKARTRPPVSDGEMVFSSTKITPPCFRSSSTQALSNGGIVVRS